MSDKKLMRHSFIVFSILLYVFMLLLTGIIFIFSMRQIIRNNKATELSQVLETERVRLDSALNSEITIVLKLAESPLIRRFFQNPDDDSLNQFALEEIASYRDAFQSGSIFWISDADGMFHSDENEPYFVDPDDPSNYWYLMTLNETELFNFNINYNPDLGFARLWINAPVFDDTGQPLGILGTGIQLDDYYDTLYQHIDPDMDLYIFDESGVITGSRNMDSVVNKALLTTELGDLASTVLEESRALADGETISFDGVRSKIAISNIPTLGWHAVAIIPIGLSDYMNSLMVLFILMLVVIAIILVIFNLFIGSTMKSLRYTMESLAAASKVKSDFLAKMSHEIRTPMNSVIGMADLALRENLPMTAREQVLTIKQSGGNLLDIINDILDFSKIEAQKMEIVPSDYHLSTLVNDVVSIIRMRISEAQVRFAVNVDGSVPNALYGDEVRIRQIMMNILGNAAKFTEKGFVTLHISYQPLDESSIYLVISIADSGRGIREEDLKVLFQEFTQVDLGNTHKIEGTGLGLSITQGLTKAMGGHIDVDSVYGEGSTFTVTIPQKIRESQKVAFVEHPDGKRCLFYERREINITSIKETMDSLGVYYKLVTTEVDFYREVMSNDYTYIMVASVLYDRVKQKYAEFKTDAKLLLVAKFDDVVSDRNVRVIRTPIYSVPVAAFLNDESMDSLQEDSGTSEISFFAPDSVVLVVDDISINLMVAEGLLQAYGLQVDSCLSGAEALEAVSKKKYDLIFMDHMMPEMDGIEAVHRIREMESADGYYQKVPIVALTANAVSGTKEMFLKNGFNDFLSKPIDLGMMDKILVEYVPKEKQQEPVEIDPEEMNV